MQRFTLCMAIAVFNGAALTACAVQPERKETPPSDTVPSLTARDLQLQEPVYAGALIHNMRAVLERGSLTHRLFFSEEQLRATFGGSAIEWIQNTPDRVHAWLGPLDYLPVRWRDDRGPRVGFLWWRSSSSVPDKPVGNFGMWCECNLRNTDIEAVFGDVDRTVDRDRRLDGSHHPVPPRATHPLGNKVVLYKLRGPEGYASSFEVRYDHQGRVTHMSGYTNPVPPTQTVGE